MIVVYVVVLLYLLPDIWLNYKIASMCFIASKHIQQISATCGIWIFHTNQNVKMVLIYITEISEYSQDLRIFCLKLGATC